MLKNIEISGLRGFGEPETLVLAMPNGEGGSGMTILVGPNNSGKTTILEALRCYNFTAEDISFSEGKRNVKTSPSGHIKLVFTSDDNVEYIVRTVDEGGSQVVVEGGMDFGKRPYILQSRRHYDYEMHNPYANDDRSQYMQNQLHNSRNRLPNMTGFEQRIFSWRKRKSEFDEVLHEIITEPFDWAIEQSDNGAFYIKIIFSNQSIVHTREGMGDGYWSIFTIADALYDSRPGDIIAIDEPELSLHPSMQKRVMKLLEEYSKDRQIVVVTHSQYFVSLQAIMNGAELARFHKDDNGNIRINVIDNVDRDFVRSLMGDIFNPHVLGLKARELFFSEDNLVITEGQEDVMIISKICDSLNLEISAELFGWGAGGAEKIRKILRMLSNLGYTKVTALYDGDKREEYDVCRQEFPNYNVLILSTDDIRDKSELYIQGKNGMADKHGNLKPENESDFRELVNSINGYHSEEDFTAPEC